MKKCKVLFNKWDGIALNINETCSKLGEKSRQILTMHALTGCDTTSYPYGKGKISALKTLLTGEFTPLQVLGDVGASCDEIFCAALPYYLALYGQAPTTSLQKARFDLFCKNKKHPKIMSLPATEDNVKLHILRAHLQVMLWKSANFAKPPNESLDIAMFGWKLSNDIPLPTVSSSPPAPQEILELINCQCKSQTMCNSHSYGCNKAGLSCTRFCACSASNHCCNKYTVQHIAYHMNSNVPQRIITERSFQL